MLKFIRDRKVAYVVAGSARAPHPGSESPVCVVWNHGNNFCGFDFTSAAVAWLAAEGYKPTQFGA